MVLLNMILFVREPYFGSLPDQSAMASQGYSVIVYLNKVSILIVEACDTIFTYRAQNSVTILPFTEYRLHIVDDTV